MQGTGVDFSLNANGATSVTVSSGHAAEFPLLMSSEANTPGTATLACTGTPANATCVITPASVPLGSTTTISLTVDTGVKVASMEHAPMLGQTVWWALALPFALPFLRRRRLGLLCLSLMTAVLFVAGCGSGRTIPGDGGGGGTPVITPPGTYTIIASATSAGLTKSVTLTLVVQ